MGKHGGLGQSRGRDDDHVLTRFLSNIEDVETAPRPRPLIMGNGRVSSYSLSTGKFSNGIESRTRIEPRPANFTDSRQNFPTDAGDEDISLVLFLFFCLF